MEEEMSPRRIELYVRSVEVPTGGPGRTLFHCDECERHHGIDVDRLKTPAHLTGRAFPEADWQAINLIRRLQEKTQCEVEIVDLSESFWQRIKLRRYGIGKTPQFVVNGQVLPPITSFDQLTGYLDIGLV